MEYLWFVVCIWSITETICIASAFGGPPLPLLPFERTTSFKEGLAATRRRGAVSRTKNPRGFGDPKESIESVPQEPIQEDPTPEVSGNIYSLPALYDIAFGYRSYSDEVEFLLRAHEKHSSTSRAPSSVLELAAGPARHSLEVLSSKDSPVSSVTALDSSQDMVDYGRGLASIELVVEKKSFNYLKGDMRNHTYSETFDTAWILLGSLQHLTSNQDIISCFRSVHKALNEGGTLIIELPHPRETFTMVECTRNGWVVPLEDDRKEAFGELRILWGDEGDVFDPISQIRYFTVSMEVLTNKTATTNGLQSVKEIVPMRQFTSQEIDALARCAGFETVALYGALDEDVSLKDEDGAFRLVGVLQKIETT